MEPDFGHKPVLLRQVAELLRPGEGELVVDATIGLGGHAEMLCQSLGPGGTLLGLDVDADNLEAAAQRLEGLAPQVVLVRRNFAELPDVLTEQGLPGADVILADLGVSSRHLDEASRGFSFSVDGPLDMRLDDRLPTTAADLVNRLREQELADLIFLHGQERFSRRIARRICDARREGRITRTQQLAQIVASAVKVDPKSRRSKIHPATRTFQALRIAVNDELGALDSLLDAAPRCLKPGGRFGVISFHSLEDGRVKRAFLDGKRGEIYSIVTKKPVIADDIERGENPRSRSAKLRVVTRTDRPIDSGQSG